ncbi:mesoderm induction early response protein 1-like isoform X2 [Daphnia pulex]|uniref:mesoderm induction early response protein 1-like isoform X2 n=1 Tax=Daphnia pulex TaxID=6669 RepID=UPI001EE1518F|nr:mesoderm induction early response protein 1-like isoform X2 [Daphnia pulex]
MADSLLKDGEQSPEKPGDGDQEFEPTAEMLVHDFDDEQTLAEEEAIASAGGEDPQNELNNLQKLHIHTRPNLALTKLSSTQESDMPIEQLLALYGYGDRGSGAVGGNGEVAAPTDARLPEEELEEDMEEDEEEDDDESLESESSSSGNAISSKKDLPAEDPNALPEEAALPVKASAEIKPRSDLHLLYPNEEGNVPEARLLRSSGTAGAAPSDEEADEEDDVDYAPGEDEWRKTIMIGSEYQSSVPSGLSPYDNIQTVPYENEDKLLWTPWVLDDATTDDYLRCCAQIQIELMKSKLPTSANKTQQTLYSLGSLPMGAHTRDDEQALHQLLQCGHNVEEAVRRRKMSNVTPCDNVSLWSEEECRNFESGLRVFGKDFHHIQQQKVRTRSVGELVQFYYLWKKTERHDVLANRARLEKKKYALHPGTTDYMDRFLDEQELQGTNATAATTHHITRERSNSRSSSPNVHSLIYGDPKRLRVAVTPPAGGEDGAPNGLPVAGDEAGLLDGADESNGQVLSAAAAAAAAAATVLPPPSDAMTSSSRDLMS